MTRLRKGWTNLQVSFITDLREHFYLNLKTPYGKENKKLEKEKLVKREKLEKEIEELNSKIEEIKANKIFENARISGSVE